MKEIKIHASTHQLGGIELEIWDNYDHNAVESEIAKLVSSLGYKCNEDDLMVSAIKKIVYDQVKYNRNNAKISEFDIKLLADALTIKIVDLNLVAYNS